VGTIHEDPFWLLTQYSLRPPLVCHLLGTCLKTSPGKQFFPSVPFPSFPRRARIVFIFPVWLVHPVFPWRRVRFLVTFFLLWTLRFPDVRTPPSPLSCGDGAPSLGGSSLSPCFNFPGCYTERFVFTERITQNPGTRPPRLFHLLFGNFLVFTYPPLSPVIFSLSPTDLFVFFFAMEVPLPPPPDKKAAGFFPFHICSGPSAPVHQDTPISPPSVLVHKNWTSLQPTLGRPPLPLV